MKRRHYNFKEQYIDKEIIEEKKVEEENFNDVNDFINNENKTQYNINKRLSQNNGVYKKLKTPDKKYTYYRKKKIII